MRKPHGRRRVILCHSEPGDSSIGCTVPAGGDIPGVVRELEGLVKQRAVLTRGGEPCHSSCARGNRASSGSRSSGPHDRR